MNDLGQYIEQQRQAGKVESAGSFTLAIEKARDKLSTYSFTKPEDYILKVVQCAVALQVDSLSIELQRDTVLIFFELEQTNQSLSISNLSDALLSPLEEKDPARAHLSLALCAIASQEPVELMWGDWGESTSTILSLGHGRSELFREVPFPRTEPLERGRRLHLLYLKKKSEGIALLSTRKEHKTVRERCCFAPLQVRLNGKEIGPHLPTFVSTSDPVRQLTGLYLGAFSLEADQAAKLRWPSESKARHRSQRLPSELKLIAPGLPPAFVVENAVEHPLPLEGNLMFSRIYGIPSFLYGPSNIYYVLHGVLLDPVMVHDAGGGAFAILDGNHLKTDLTGLQAIMSDSVEADKRSVSSVWRELADAFVSEHPPIFRNSLAASGEDALGHAFKLLMLGPLKRILEPIYDQFIFNRRKRELVEKKYHRQLETRRGYLSYSKNSD